MSALSEGMVASAELPQALPKSVLLPQAVWDAGVARHHARVSSCAESFLERRRRGEKHPVWDFLFTYYSFSPNKLMTWVPGIFGDARTEYEEGEQTTEWTCPPLPERVRREAAWIAQLCQAVQARPARLNCHGLHEWAMVYRQSADEVRHNCHALRLRAEELAVFIESQSLCCSHYDAFRFFTPEARPLNTLSPSLETRVYHEQPGCLHVNMDLYKWAHKLWPWIGSDLVADAFEIAIAAREMDMRASPYDLAELGFAPICIETESGRAEYRREQQDLMLKAQPVRERLQQAAAQIALYGL
jgi:hypothetical protein